MDRALACCVLAVVCTLGATAERGHYGAYPSYHELAKFEEALHRTASEKRFLRERVDMLKNEKFKLDEFISDDVEPQISDLQDEGANQNNMLATIKQRVMELLGRLGDTEAQVAGAAAVAQRNMDNIKPRWDQILPLADDNIRQTAKLTKTDTTIKDSAAKLLEKLVLPSVERQNGIQAVNDDSLRFSELVNIRKCYVDYAHVDVDHDLAQGTVDVMVPSDLNTEGNVPTAFCGIQGVISKLKDKRSKGYGGYGYPDELQNTVVTVDCKATESNVTVKVFDQSRGDGNKIVTAFVQVKACFIAPQTGF